MEKYEICGKEADMIVDNRAFCAAHYVKNEGEECLRNDLMFVSEGSKLGISEEIARMERIIREIRNIRLPHFFFNPPHELFRA